MRVAAFSLMTTWLSPGTNPKNKASVYNMDGWVQDLPDLNQGRYKHGCGHYVDNDNNLVYLVTGGWSGVIDLLSTEILRSGDSAWTDAGNLPSPMSALSGVSWQNKIIMTGGENYYLDEVYDTVLSFDGTTNEWTQVGNMKQKRKFHAISVVNADLVMDYCLADE